MTKDGINNLSPEKISEDDFFSDLNRAKIIVDNGITDYFILANPKSFEHVKEIGNTTLKDCVDLFGLGYVLFFRFAGFFDCGNNGATKDEYQSFRIRPATKSDKAKLRNDLKFVPPETWVCDWRDGNGFGALLPFIQDDKTGVITWLCRDKRFRKRPVFDDGVSAPEYYMHSFIEVLPDYFDCQLAVVNYKGVDICIPIAPGAAKHTFKNRAKDESGVKRHIVHPVKQHERAGAKKDVERHLRGRSDIVIRGETVTISAPLEFSQERQLRKAVAKMHV